MPNNRKQKKRQGVGRRWMKFNVFINGRKSFGYMDMRTINFTLV